jgi:hypothetical protein
MNRVINNAVSVLVSSIFCLFVCFFYLYSIVLNVLKIGQNCFILFLFLYDRLIIALTINKFSKILYVPLINDYFLNKYKYIVRIFNK